MLTRWRSRGRGGSGMAIGVAMTFPALMLIIVSISLLTGSGRIDQAVKNAANRAARTAALCCHYTGGPGGAEEVALASLRSSEDAAVTNRILCNNDLVADSRIVFVDVAGNDVAVAPDAAVPPGGTVHVFARCRVPIEILGGFGFPGLDAERRVEGVAAVDPHRARAGG